MYWEVFLIRSSYKLRGQFFLTSQPLFWDEKESQDLKDGGRPYRNMPKKRASRGRSKGGKGSSGVVHCSQCGALVPRDKAKKVTGRITLVEPTLAKELRAAGAYIPLSTDVKFYCVSCAVHRGIVKVRSEAERRSAGKLR